MLRIKPDIGGPFTCPRCSQNPVMKEVLLQPTFALAEFVCGRCHFDFFQTLPVGHTIIDTLTIAKITGKLYPINTKTSWLADTLLKAHHGEKQEQVQIKKIIYKNCEKVIVLNTLDFLYGHVMLKLYNAIYHLDHHKNLGLIIVLPKLFEWLIPEGCAEAWIVDLKLNDLTYFHSSIQKFVSNEFERFNTIYLSKAYSHPDFSAIDISRLTGVKPFDLRDFTQLRPSFTFVLRQDRWWMPCLLDYWFYRLCRKLKVLKFGSLVLSMRQNRLVKKTISIIRKKLPDANFHIVGLGTTGEFKGYAHDQRADFIDNSIEKKWCDIYAGSHV